MSRKLTHSDYIKKLEDKEIKTQPLEKYKGAHVKILHKCICGNDYKVTPTHVYKGVTCGCSKKKDLKYSTKEYKKKLQDYNINVKCIDIYKGVHTKILHKCTCGNEWMIAPNHVIKDVKCGCRPVGYAKTPRDKNVVSFHINNEKTYKDRRTILYYIKVNEFYKIGVTLFKKSVEKSIKRRFSKDISNGVIIEILQSKIYENGAEAYLLEQNILQRFNNYLVLNESVLVSGNTELFSKDIRKIKQIEI